MEKVELPLLPIHEHPLLPITRFGFECCKGCGVLGYIYGGYRCNEVGCESVFHRECAESLPEINHSSHPAHPLKLLPSTDEASCSRCGSPFKKGYICSICDFKLDLRCGKGTPLILENSIQHQHPLKRLLLFQNPRFANDECLLCGFEFKNCDSELHHCDVCNFSICKFCMINPPPVVVESPTTHQHQLHLVPRRIAFTCDACGTLGDRSPYFCLHCNFMIHRQCIDLPRVININRHDHRIFYAPRLGHNQEEEWECKVCRNKIDGFYGAYFCKKIYSFYGVYTCKKSLSLAVHSRCATRPDVWDMVELEGMPEEEDELPPFEVIDEYTIKHFSHHHNLRISEDGYDPILPDNVVCEACRLHIISEQFYSCELCPFILHEKCANHPRKKRHFSSNQQFTLLTDSLHKVYWCVLCVQNFTGFRYKAGFSGTIDVRCAAISDRIEHGSHKLPLYYTGATAKVQHCSRCGQKGGRFFCCDKCDYALDGKCAQIPEKVMRNRYDDHPLVLSFGEKNVDGDYWCEACETKVNPEEWFYTCHECGTILHIDCVVGDFSYIMPGSSLESGGEVVSNTSVCRPICSGGCNSRCKLPSIFKYSDDGVDRYDCSLGFC